MGHLQRYFAKMTNARQTPGGGGWAPMELIETLSIKHIGLVIFTIYIDGWPSHHFVQLDGNFMLEAGKDLDCEQSLLKIEGLPL